VRSISYPNCHCCCTLHGRVCAEVCLALSCLPDAFSNHSEQFRLRIRLLLLFYVVFSLARSREMLLWSLSHCLILSRSYFFLVNVVHLFRAFLWNLVVGGGRLLSLIIFILIFIWTANGALAGCSGTIIRHNTQLHISHKTTHHAQSKHCTNNQGHIKHSEYNEKIVKLSL
jgi:hypothetical protein